MNGTREEFSEHVDEFESLIEDTLHLAIENKIMLYCSPMVVEIQPGPTRTIM